MIIKAPLGTYEAIAEVCAFHLGPQLVKEHDYMFIPGWFLDVEQAHVTDKKLQQQAIIDIEGSLKLALRKFYELHPDRIAPVRKDALVSFELPEIGTAEDAANAARAILKAVAEGEITPLEAATVMSVVEQFRRTLETTEIEQRIAALEAAK